MRNLDSWPRVGFLGGDRIPSLGFVSIRPPAVLPHLHQDHISHSHLAWLWLCVHLCLVMVTWSWCSYLLLAIQKNNALFLLVLGNQWISEWFWLIKVTRDEVIMLGSPLNPQDTAAQLTTFKSYLNLIGDCTPGSKLFVGSVTTSVKLWPVCLPLSLGLFMELVENGW